MRTCLRKLLLLLCLLLALPCAGTAAPISFPGCIDAPAFAAAAASVPQRYWDNNRWGQGAWTVYEYDEPGWKNACAYYHVPDPDTAYGSTIPWCKTIIVRIYSPPSFAWSPLQVFWHELGHAVLWPGMTDRQRLGFISSLQNGRGYGNETDQAGCRFAGIPDPFPVFTGDAEEIFAEDVRKMRTPAKRYYGMSHAEGDCIDSLFK